MHVMPQGTVYGTLLNFRGEVAATAALMDQPPYKAPPKAPVLYVKPANTWSTHGTAIQVPARVPEVEIGATIAMVMGQAGAVVAYVLMNDLSIPHASFFRPPVKFKCLDGFLGIGNRQVTRADVGEPAQFTLEVRINGVLKQSVHFGNLVRNTSQLLADVSEFMTLHPGDVLMLGCDVGRPLAKVGDRIDISAPGFGTLSNTLVAEEVNV
ncbi:fumarylacetoacetate hydrolase family protein [Polaromonas sp. SM01]|uniref:fumarylacetoacetate hydrolase family protein n=1 Tax=Polaromonas sp. SM01 TaxID=3085630 RepID=UPI002981CCE7|nr:fumarylacetoacetate hydrolase family protein [Polaromonas sp. SM01]MDW5440986.1 fumarylacetoacetate hydrolase family protein [Polaromonas sp. SM01]